MGIDKDKRLPELGTELRHLSELQLRSEQSPAVPFPTDVGSQRLIHELQVHQIELEMQNEELRRAWDERDKMEALLGKYSDLYDFAPVGYFNLDRKGIIRAVNLTGARFLEVERSLLTSQRMDLFISHETRPAFHAFLDKVFTSENKEKCEFEFLIKGHSPFFVQVEAVVSESKEECRAVIIDITEQKRAEEALQRAKKEWEWTFDSVPDLITIIDNQHRILRVNEAMARRLGLKFKECIGSHCHETVHGLSEPPEFCPHTRTLRDCRQHVEEIYEERLGGDFWVSTTPLQDDQGVAIGTVHIAHDITARKRSEEALRQSEEQFHTLFNTLNEGFCIIEVLFNEDDHPIDYRFLKINPAFEAQTGLLNAQGKLMRELAPELEAHWFEMYGKVAMTGEPVHFVNEAKALNRWYDVNAYRVGGQDSRKVAILFNDISEAKRAETELRNAHDEMEKRVEERTAELREKDQLLLLQSRLAAMGEMIGNIAHQWRQPLNTLGLTVQQLSLIDDPEELTIEFLEECVNSSMELIQYMSKTIDDFRNYFKPDKEMIEFKVRETIDNTLSLLEGSLQNSKISIEIVDEHSPVINGYPNEFAQVLINILNNARDALIEKKIDDPRVTITIWSEDGCAVVTIADNAGGIPEEILDKIFDPYFTTKGPQLGTGVGLFMSKAIIEKNMRGRLTVRNIDNGAEFRITV